MILSALLLGLTPTVFFQEPGETELEFLREARRMASDLEAELGPDHPDYAKSLYEVGVLYMSNGLYSEARRVLERALDIQERAYGPHHASVAISVGALGSLESLLGSKNKARPLLERSLAIHEITDGPRQRYVATALLNYATLLRELEFYTEARQLYERVLAIREKTVGPNSISVAMTLHNLAILLQAQGSYKDARSLLKRSLAISESHSYGKMKAHTLTIFGKNEVALGFHKDALSMFESALSIFEKQYGGNNPGTVESLVNLAEFHRGIGAYAEARPIYERGLDMTLSHLSINLGSMTEAERFRYLDIQVGPEPLLLNLVAMQGNGPKKTD